MHHYNLLIRQTDARIKSGDFWIAPVLNGTEINRGDRLAIELEGGRAGQVVRDYDRAGDRWNVQQFARCVLQIFVAHRAVGSAEVDGLGNDLLLAAAGADRLIVEAH